MTQIKIGLTGVHGSGKSTKAKELSAHYIDAGKSVLVVEEVARSCPYPLGTIEAQEYIWTHQMAAEKHAMRQNVDVVICDRTVMDNLMYYHKVISSTQKMQPFLKEWHHWDVLYCEAINWMSTYSQVIRLPLNFEYLKADDPIRPKSPRYARKIDNLFDRFVQWYVTD